MFLDLPIVLCSCSDLLGNIDNFFTLGDPTSPIKFLPILLIIYSLPVLHANPWPNEYPLKDNDMINTFKPDKVAKVQNNFSEMWLVFLDPIFWTGIYRLSFPIFTGWLCWGRHHEPRQGPPDSPPQPQPHPRSRTWQLEALWTWGSCSGLQWSEIQFGISFWITSLCFVWFG